MIAQASKEDEKENGPGPSRLFLTAACTSLANLIIESTSLSLFFPLFRNASKVSSMVYSPERNALRKFSLMGKRALTLFSPVQSSRWVLRSTWSGRDRKFFEFLSWAKKKGTYKDGLNVHSSIPPHPDSFSPLSLLESTKVKIERFVIEVDGRDGSVGLIERLVGVEHCA